MGIYESGDIYGIKFYNYSDDVENILHEKISDTIFTREMIDEAKQCYEELIKSGMRNISIKIYTSFCDTYSTDSNTHMGWFSMTKDIFIKK